MNRDAAAVAENGATQAGAAATIFRVGMSTEGTAVARTKGRAAAAAKSALAAVTDAPRAPAAPEAAGAAVRRTSTPATGIRSVPTISIALLARAWHANIYGTTASTASRTLTSLAVVPPLATEKVSPRATNSASSTRKHCAATSPCVAFPTITL